MTPGGDDADEAAVYTLEDGSTTEEPPEWVTGNYHRMEEDVNGCGSVWNLTTHRFPHKVRKLSSGIPASTATTWPTTSRR
jgi:hypothetical protein